MDADNENPEMLAALQGMGDFVSSVARAEVKQGNCFLRCVRASFAKTFEFNLLTWQPENTGSSFFWMPTLRGICEDLIILSFINGMPPNHQEDMTKGLLHLELRNSLEAQQAFFNSERDHQRVLSVSTIAVSKQDLEKRVRDAWRANGWPNLQRVMPPTRQIAEKSSSSILAKLYDYLFRLTSETVHFNVRGLMKTGWGELPHVTFSPTHFSNYYTAFNRVYGCYMFCCFFELFCDELAIDSDTNSKVSAIRRRLLEIPRWPEMVTFEELNIKPPSVKPSQLDWASIVAENQASLLGGTNGKDG